jgi:hypothetical protein
MNGPARVVAALLALVISVLTALLIAGHGPWAGPTLIAFNPYRGINAGDVPVLALWAVGMAGCGYLLRKS